jgi:serine/threonine protein kinase
MTDATRLANALEERYRIERQLGAGGMATVYLATDLKHDREVALKVLRRELGAVLGAERFLVEIKITARLDHPRHPRADRLRGRRRISLLRAPAGPRRVSARQAQPRTAAGPR